MVTGWQAADLGIFLSKCGTQRHLHLGFREGRARARTGEGRDDLGRLQKGAKADIAVVNLRDITFGAVRDPIRSLMENAVSRDVRALGRSRPLVAVSALPEEAAADFTVYLATPATSERMCADGGLSTENSPVVSDTALP